MILLVVATFKKSKTILVIKSLNPALSKKEPMQEITYGRRYYKEDNKCEIQVI